MMFNDEVKLRDEIRKLEAKISGLEIVNKSLLDTCVKMQEQIMEQDRVIASLQLEKEEFRKWSNMYYGKDDEE